MKRAIAALAGVVLLAAACGGPAAAPSPSPTAARTPSPSPSPSPSPTPVAKVVFTADLKPSNEVPPIANAESSCTGTGTFTLDLTRDSAGKVSSATAAFEAKVSGCPSGTALNIMHIHDAPAGVNAGVKVNSGLAAGQLTLTAGAGSITKTGIAVDGALVQAILDKPDGYYYNIHSTLNPGGVLRGQLKKS